MPWFYYISSLVMRMSLFLLARWQVRGKENIPGQGAVLVVANHLNLADPPLLAVSLRRKVTFMAKKELFRFKFIGYFIGSFGAFPVHRGRLDRKALHRADQVLAQGQTLIMFPEGMRSRSGKLGPAFSGSALVALRSSAPLLPIGISGTEKIRGVGWIPHRHDITVNIGHPFYLPPVRSKLTKVELAKLTTYIMEHIAGLLPPEYRGSYATRKSDDIKN
jgi:1-acyl-sn-glycerol-3-phosphate acyltransferase